MISQTSFNKCKNLFMSVERDSQSDFQHDTAQKCTATIHLVRKKTGWIKKMPQTNNLGFKLATVAKAESLCEKIWMFQVLQQHSQKHNVFQMQYFLTPSKKRNSISVDSYFLTFQYTGKTTFPLLTLERSE